MGMIIIFFMSIGVYAFDFEKERFYQPLKTLIIIAFVSLSMKQFVEEAGGYSQLDITEVAKTTPNFGFVLGIIAFSYS